MSPADAERYMTDPAPQQPDPGAAPLAAPSDRELTDQFWDRIRLFACRRLGDRSAAEDVAQETIRRVIEALRAGRVENLAALPGFVFQTARHICLQHHRSAGREARALSRLTSPGTTLSIEADALRALITEERCREVRSAIARLADEDRELLRLAYYDQEETAVIAERLGVSTGALRVRKHRVLKRLGELLGEAEP
jgi:RNA polymerase sigma-70 factor (ECF subfamily)